jgi:hypothetical protein
MNWQVNGEMPLSAHVHLLTASGQQQAYILEE